MAAAKAAAKAAAAAAAAAAAGPCACWPTRRAGGPLPTVRACGLAGRRELRERLAGDGPQQGGSSCSGLQRPSAPSARAPSAQPLLAPTAAAANDLDVSRGGTVYFTDSTVIPPALNEAAPRPFFDTMRRCMAGLGWRGAHASRRLALRAQAAPGTRTPGARALLQPSAHVAHSLTPAHRPARLERSYMLSMFHGVPSGRLLALDPASGVVQVLEERLYFANGVVSGVPPCRLVGGGEGGAAQPARGAAVVSPVAAPAPAIVSTCAQPWRPPPPPRSALPQQTASLPGAGARRELCGGGGDHQHARVAPLADRAQGGAGGRGACRQPENTHAGGHSRSRRPQRRCV